MPKLMPFPTTIGRQERRRQVQVADAEAREGERRPARPAPARPAAPRRRRRAEEQQHAERDDHHREQRSPAPCRQQRLLLRRVGDDVARDPDAHRRPARPPGLVDHALDRGEDGGVARHLARGEGRSHDDDLQAAVLRDQRRRVLGARLRRVELLLQLAQAIGERRPAARRPARVVIHGDEQRVEPRLSLRQLVSNRRQILGRDQQMAVFPDEAILGRAVVADTDDRAGGKRRQPIAHQARGGRAPFGVVRFDRDDDRPEHLGARLPACADRAPTASAAAAGTTCRRAAAGAPRSAPPRSRPAAPTTRSAPGAAWSSGPSAAQAAIRCHVPPPPRPTGRGPASPAAPPTPATGSRRPRTGPPPS